MGNDFLWDRTGADPEIEALEAKLAIFRPSSLRAPQIPAPPRQRSILGIPLTFVVPAAAFSVIAVALMSVLVYLYTPSETPAVETIARNAPATVPPPVAEMPVESAASPDLTRTVVSADPVEPRAVIKRSARSSTERKDSVPAGKAVDKLAGFSDEEKAAYEQLMLALSVTSSSFRLVQEKLGAESAGIPLLSPEQSPVRSN